MDSDAKNTKLIINLRDGIVQVEGEESFVRDVYNDFKERVSKPVLFTPQDPPQIEQRVGDVENADVVAPPSVTKTQRTKSRRAAPSSSGTMRGETTNYKPKFNANLDLSALPAFYDKYKPATHPEKILIFGTFLKDTMKIEPFTADDIFTCYGVLQSRTKTPGAFLQAFRDTQNNKHFVEYKSPHDIRLTIAGTNYLNFDLKKKGDTE